VKTTGQQRRSWFGAGIAYNFLPAARWRWTTAASFQGFRSLIENSPDAISLIDTQGEILYGSSSTTRIFGYQPEELVGQNCLQLIHPEDRDHSSRTLQEVLAKPPGPLHWDARVRHKDGNYSWVESTVSNMLFNSEIQAIVMQQRDIHARRAGEMKVQERAEELARERGETQDVNFGSQIRSYVLHPYTMVKDHRTDFEVGNANGVLDGDLDGFVRAWLETNAKNRRN
jgi:PAS domain S-box-containing protein